jgi:hypothetical protein
LRWSSPGRDGGARSAPTGLVVGLGGALGMALAGVTAIGCSTAYQPRPSGRVSVAIHHGAAVYVKNGREVPIGPLGGELENLVADTPVAIHSAHRARNQLTAGVPSYVGGLGAVVVGLALSGPVGWLVLGVGAASAATGLTLIGAGFTNAVDAVNLHNDATPDGAGGPASRP